MVDPELEALRREFLAEANDKVHEMELSAARLSPESLARLTHLAHQLKGSGGSYGFQLISDEASEVETAIEDGMLTLRMDCWMKVMKGITTMEQMIRETSA